MATRAADVTTPDIRVKYDGGDADEHAVDMRLLGASMQGADKIISDGLIVLVYGRLPKRRERAPVISKVREPVAGSYELWALWEAVKGLLPLGLPSSKDLAGHFISEWWNGVISKFSGKPEAAEKCIEAMGKIVKEMNKARDRSEQRAHELQQVQLAVIREAMAMQGRAIEQFAAPVGPSVNKATIYPLQGRPALLTTEDADAIRESNKLEWQAIAEIELRTDGFKFHTNGLSVENPDGEGFLMARVHDPRFEQEENVYTEAAQRRSSIVVLARKGYRGGILTAIEILEFKHEIPPSAA